MTKRAQKPKNKAFKNFSVPKSASNEREREGERSPAQTLPPFSLYLKALRYDDTKRLHNLLAKFTLFEFKKLIFEF